MKAVRVIHNPLKSQNQPWLVYCDYCKGGDSWMSLFAGPVGWAPRWSHAQFWAQDHARKHEATRCTTCLQVPQEPLREKASN